MSITDMSITDISNKVINELVQRGFASPMIYGSWCYYEKYKFDDKYPNDIDVINIVHEESEEGEFTLELNCIDIPVNVECMTLQHFRQDYKTPQIKYLGIGLAGSNNSSINHIFLYLGAVHSYYAELPKNVVRTMCSSSSSKAFNKGVKKLTLDDDYDKDLGLKNIWHSIHFISIVDSYYKSYDDSLNVAEYALYTEYNMLRCIPMRDMIYKIYEETEGSLQDKAQAVIDYAKPLRNKLMTEFRALYSKE